MSITSTLAAAAVLLLPAIPGVLLYFFLDPATFWQKTCWFILSAFIYCGLMFFISQT